MQVDDQSVTRVLANGVSESISWAELNSVELARHDFTSDEAELYFVLSDGAGAGCAVPSSQAPEQLIEKLLELPGMCPTKLSPAKLLPLNAAAEVIWQKA